MCYSCDKKLITGCFSLTTKNDIEQMLEKDKESFWKSMAYRKQNMDDSIVVCIMTQYGKQQCRILWGG